MEYKDSFNYDESDEQQRKRQEHNPNDPYGLGAASPGDPYGLSSVPQDDLYSLQPREAAPDLGPKAKKKEPTDPQQRKDSEPQAPSSKSDTDQPEDKAKPLFGVSTPELEKHVGKSTDVQEAQADALAKEVTAEPANDAQQKPTKAEIPSPSQSAAPHLPGLPTTGGKKLSKEDQQKFGKKVGDLSDVEIHKAPKAAKYLDAEAFTVGRRIYKGKNANKDTISHEIAHFSPQDKTTGKLRRKSSSDSWAERERQKRIAAEQAEARRKERERIAAEKAAEAKRIEIAKAAAARRVAAAKAAAIKKEAELRALGRFDPITGQSFTQKKDLSALEAKVKKQQAINAAERKANPKPPVKTLQPLTKPKDLSALEEKVKQKQAQKAADKQAKLQKTVEQHPGIAGVLKQPFFKNALAFGAGLMSPALGASALAGAALIGTAPTQKQPTAQQPAPQPEEKKEEKGFFGKALDFGKNIVKGAAKVGEKVLNTGESAINTVTSALPIPQPLKDLANPIKLAKNVVKGATAIATAPQKAAGGLLDGAMSFGKDLFNGAKDLGKKALNTAGNVINGAKDLGSKALKGAVNLADSAIKTGTKLAKEFGEYAQKNPWEVAKMVTHGALDVLGFVPVFGAIADVANAGLYAAEGKYDMAAMSMLSAVPGVGDVLGPAAKAATLASKAIPTAAKVAKTLSKAEKVVNSPVGKAVTNGLPVAGTVVTAGVQAATGDGAGAMSTLANMGLPIAGKFGGKVLGKAADAAQSPAAKAAITAASKTVATGGKYAPLAMQGKDVVDKFGQYQRGEIKAEDVVQSVAGLGTATVGMKTANRMDKSLSAKPEIDVPVAKASGLEPGEAHVSYDKKGKPKVNHGDNVHPDDIQVHVDKAKEIAIERSPVQRLKDKVLDKVLGRKPEFEFGTKGWELNHEASKHQAMADRVFSEAEKLRAKGDDVRASRLEQKAHDLQRSAYEYEAQSRDPKTKELRGDGRIAANKPTYDNHSQIKGLHGKQFDPAKTKLPPGYEVMNLANGRKVCAVIDPVTGGFDMSKGIVLVRPDGKIQITTDNRTSYDYIGIYKNDPRARQDVKNTGFGRDGYTIHHAIPDKVASKHPLTVMAMRLSGYTVDTFENYAPLPMKKKFGELNGTEVGHWAGHGDFDDVVVGRLTQVQRGLEAKYSAPIADWKNHPQKDKIAAELEARISALQTRTVSDIEKGDVPMTNEGMSGGMGRIR
jgi:hypothetical protein